jgi:hypothetical protein
MKTAIIGLIIGFSLAGNIYAYALHTGAVVSVKAACAESTDLIDGLMGKR